MKKVERFTLEDLTVESINEEISREKYKRSYSRMLRNTLGVLIIIIAICAIVATILMPVLEVTDSSMAPVINDKDVLVSIKSTSVKRGDIIAFYHGNKILIKRVIGVSGDYINIDEEGNVYVNGEKLKEEYVSELKRGDTKLEFPYQVSDNKVFVLSDDRSNLFDSRNIDIGEIKKEDIIGKVVLRVWPIKSVSFIK